MLSGAENEQGDSDLHGWKNATEGVAERVYEDLMFG